MAKRGRVAALLVLTLGAVLSAGCRREPPRGREPCPPAAVPLSIHVGLGVPRATGPTDDVQLVKPQYVLAYGVRRSVASWVSWELDGSWLGDVPRFRGKFLTDESLPMGAYRVRHEDYIGSGFDRGHMVPSEDRTRSPEDNQATFLLTNVLPQRHELNAGPWLRLEQYCQSLVRGQDKEVFLMAGGLFEGPPRTLDHGIAVPDSFFKIVVVLDRGQGAADVTDSTRVIAVIMPNSTDVAAGWGGYRTTVTEIERRAGYDFLTAVPEPIQRVIEARVDQGPTHAPAHQG